MELSDRYSYRVFWSEDLVDWVDLGADYPGTNGLMQATIPTGTDPQRYFRLRAQN